MNERALEARGNAPDGESGHAAGVLSNGHLADWTQVMADWNATDSEYPRDKCLDDLFEARVVEGPERLAVLEGDQSLTYAELDARANRLSDGLRRQGVDAGSRVALLLPRSTDLVVCELAVVKTGAVYVPLDGGAPAERLAFQIEDSECKVVLTTAGQAVPHGVQAKVLRLDTMQSESGNTKIERVKSSSEAPVYVMYTSGSTGRPKGVEIPHRAITRLIFNNGYTDFCSSDRVAFVANPSFDPSTLEVWAPLLTGGCVVVMDAATVLAPERLRQAVQQQRVTVLHLTSGLFNQYALTLGNVFSQLRCLLVGGDVVDVSEVRRVLESSSPRRIVHMYGPTETTLFATFFEVTDATACGARLPIGRPLANTRVYVLDDEKRPAPIEEVGELYIGGAGVALGYCRRPKLTAERFVPDPFAAGPGARLYRTGDLGRWTRDGQIEFLGRTDSQVKVRGFRIELGEIEARLKQHSSVHEVLVAVREDEAGEKSLVAYFTLNDGARRELAGARSLRQHLSMALPEYMVPSAYVLLERFPLTPNGKVDRVRLPPPELGSVVTGAYEAPCGVAEEVLAKLWSELLHVERVGRHDNFFELGGDSIRVIKLLWKLRELGYEAQPHQVTDCPVLSRMASCLGKIIEADAEQGQLQGEVPLTIAQRRFFAGNPPSLDHYNQAQVFELRSRWSLPDLIVVIAALESRHDALRARFGRTRAGWVQVYGSGSERLPVAAIDARQIDDEVTLSEWLQARATEVHRSLDVREGPLYRVCLIHRTREDLLLFVVHHLAVDSVSWKILADDLNRLFELHLSGKPLELGLKTSSCRQWADGLHEWAQGSEGLDELLHYWLPLATQRACVDPPGLSAEGEHAEPEMTLLGIPPDETSRLLKEASAALQAHVNEVLLTALGLALYDTFGTPRWRIQLEGHGREPELVPGADPSRTVGWFTSEFPFVLDVSSASWLQAVTRVKLDFRAVPHKGAGFGPIRELRASLSDAERDVLNGLESPIRFNYLGHMGSDLRHAELRASSLPAGVLVAETNAHSRLLDIMAYVDDSGTLRVEFQHSARSKALVQRLAHAFRARLAELKLCRRATANGPSEMEAPNGDRRRNMVVRTATPEDYKEVSEICIATFAVESRWVARKLGPRTWLDAYWVSDAAAKFVLESDGHVVGYLVGSLDIRGFDFRGYTSSLFRSPVLLLDGVRAWACGEVMSVDLKELVRLLLTYRVYWCWHAKQRLRSLARRIPHDRVAFFHFNVRDGYRHAGGMISLLNKWEEWLKARGEQYAYLHVSGLQGLDADLGMQQELMNGLGYRHRPRVHASFWTKDLTAA